MNTNSTETTNRATGRKASAQEGDTHRCCGGPAPAGTSACCVLDAEAKSAGDAGCGCGINVGNADVEEIYPLRVTLSHVSLSAR